MHHFGEASYEIDKTIAAHHGSFYIAKNCKCWEGYKRVPGTKPCAPGSCEKCDNHSKKSAIKLADEANNRIDAIWNQAVKIAKIQNPNIDESLKDEVIFSCLGKVNFNDITPEMMAEKILQKSNRMIMASQNNKWEEAKDIVIQRYPEEAGTNMGGGSEAVKIAKYHLDEIFDEANAIASKLGGPTVENFVAAIEQIYYLGGKTSKTSSQGDKPSPHAAQAVLAALEAGNENEAKELLKKTDCPEECETHPEGKCPHQYMSAGRTRVRYLINDSSFDKSEEPVEIKE